MQTYFIVKGWNLVALAAMMVTGWLISLAYRNVTIVDSIWGLGFVLVAWLTFFMSDGYVNRKMLIALLVTLWGLRLSIYLGVKGRIRAMAPGVKRAVTNSGLSFCSMISIMRYQLEVKEND